MTVYERKVCMLGEAGVGKTSLVRRFVDGVFSERYLSTIGVKVDRKPVPVGDDQVNMILTPSLSFLLLLNKHDRAQEWSIDPADFAALEAAAWAIVRPSAATGSGLEKSFRHLATRLLPETA